MVWRVVCNPDKELICTKAGWLRLSLLLPWTSQDKSARETLGQMSDFHPSPPVARRFQVGRPKSTSAKKTSRKSLGWLASLVDLCSSMLSRNIARSSLMILTRAFSPGIREATMPHHGSAYCNANLDLNVLLSWEALQFFKLLFGTFLSDQLQTQNQVHSVINWVIPVQELHQPLGLWVFKVESLSSDNCPKYIDHRDPKYLDFCDWQKIIWQKTVSILKSLPLWRANRLIRSSTWPCVLIVNDHKYWCFSLWWEEVFDQC